MKRYSSLEYLLSCLLIIVVSLFVVTLCAAADSGKDDIKSVIDQSTLSLQAKNSLLKSASNAEQKGIPPVDLAIIIKRALLRGWEVKAIEEAISLSVKTAEQNLPARPVLDRIQQGLSKGVPPDKVTGATIRLLDKLAVADRIVTKLVKEGLKVERPAHKEETTQNVAKALEKLVPAETITYIGSQVKAKYPSLRRFNAAISTMVSLSDMGMPVNSSSRLVSRAIDKGYSERDLFSMERDMGMALKEGWKVDDVMRNMDSVMGKGSSSQMHNGMGPGQMMGPSSQGSGMGAGKGGMGSGGMGGGTGSGGMGGGTGSGGMGGGMGGHTH
ncbi:MAG: hypothetical protein HQL08_13700 [Nitrospirae bacterium]|nr:hypothetical protein [Nitrospirota bacterium]